MIKPESVDAVRMSWLSSEGAFTVLDPDFGHSGSFSALLSPEQIPEAPPLRLRYLAILENANQGGLPFGLLNTPGLHFVDLPHLNAELHLWIGTAKAGLQEFEGQFDAVLGSSGSSEQQLYRRCLDSPYPSVVPIPQSLKSVAVLGAGIAGSSVARALCRRGVQVHLYDSANGPATGASGNWAGAFHPHITRGDSLLSKLSRLGFEHTVQALEQLTDQGLLIKGRDWDTPGHLQTVPADEAERTQDTLAQLGFPDELVHWAQANAVLPTPLGGLFFPQGGWIKPAAWVQANLDACGGLLVTHYNSPVSDLAELRKQHDAVVVCCAQNSIDLAPIRGANVGAVKGQISKLRSVSRPGVVLSGESYAIAPPLEDWLVLGATYERPVLDLEPTPQADEENITRFTKAFPDWPLGELVDHRCAVRSVWHDRLPAIGPVPDMPGVYMSTGFASRGLLWAALGGWLVADHCLGQPLDLRLLGKITPRPAKVRPQGH